MNYPKIKSVIPNSDYTLIINFSNGDVKKYDCHHLLNQENFYELKNVYFFKQVHVDPGGYGVSWNDDIDLAESELWLNGQ